MFLVSNFPPWMLVARCWMLVVCFGAVDGPFRLGVWMGMLNLSVLVLGSIPGQLFHLWADN